MNIYAGNLSYSVTDEDLKEIFGAFGEVSRANVISDRETGKSKGFGFVEMPSEAEAQAAITALNDKEVGGRRLKVNQARPREDGGGSRGGGGGGSRGGSGGSRPRNDRNDRNDRRW